MYHEHHKHRKHEDMIAWLCTDPHYAVPLPYLYPELSGAVVLGTETVCFRGLLSPGTLVLPIPLWRATRRPPARGGQRSLVRASRPGRCLFCFVLAATPCMHTKFNRAFSSFWVWRDRGGTPPLPDLVCINLSFSGDVSAKPAPYIVHVHEITPGKPRTEWLDSYNH